MERHAKLRQPIDTDIVEIPDQERIGSVTTVQPITDRPNPPNVRLTVAPDDEIRRPVTSVDRWRFGPEVRYEHNFLRGVPIARAVYEETRTSGKVERHETAPRPALPEAVTDALESDEAPATPGQSESDPDPTRE